MSTHFFHDRKKLVCFSDWNLDDNYLIMNYVSPYHSTSTEILLKRFRLWKRQYLHIVIYTSLFWIFVDVFFIMLFSDCTKEIIVPCRSSIASLSKHNSTVKINQPDLAIQHPKIIIDKIKPQIETTKKSTVRKWWEVDPAATNPPNWQGEGGRAVVIPKELQGESKKRFGENQFNILASDLMALNRSVKDQRSPK